MIDIQIEGEEILISGRFDASQEQAAEQALSHVESSMRVNLKDLEYISSAGLSVLLGVQQRLSDNGHQLILFNMSKHIRDVFRLVGMDQIFEIE